LQSKPSNKNDATFYFDAAGGPGVCGPVNGITKFAESDAPAKCEPALPSAAKPLKVRGNNVVAFNADILAGGMSKYCGKKVVVSYGGKEFTDLDLFIWDGCAECAKPGNDGLDFSSDVFADIIGKENCAKGRVPGLSWKILDEQVVPWVA